MNRKGFTIIELISVITLLALLIVLTIPTYNNVSNNIKERNFNSKKSIIEKQTIEFVNNYMKDETYKYDGNDDTKDSKNICFSTRFLIVNGIITSDNEKKEVVINDITNEKYEGDTILIAVGYDAENKRLISYTIGDEEIENYTPTTSGKKWFDENCNLTYK